MRGMRFLLAAVIIMGVMILLGTAVLIATVVHRTARHPHPQGLPAVASTTLVPGQPNGTRIISVVRQSDALLAVTLSGGGLPDRLLLWDPLSGRIVARLRLDR